MAHDDIFNSRYGPRTARGGIKSQTARGSFGKNWWAQRWLKVLENLDLGGRLARGRTYARHGQVLSVDIKEGSIESRVQGSRLQPYSVKILVKTIAIEKWVELSETAFNQAIVAAKLLAGEMPQDIEKLFADQQLSLFPKTIEDLETECSCPDYSNPCKHIASVYYLLGEEFDRDPFLIFLMRGLSKDKLIDLITKTEGTSKSEPDSPLQSKKLGKVVAATKKAPRSTNKSPDLPLIDFWKVRHSDHLVGSVVTPTVNAGLPKRLGSFSFWRSNYSFIPTLEQIYKIASERAIKDLANEKFGV